MKLTSILVLLCVVFSHAKKNHKDQKEESKYPKKVHENRHKVLKSLLEESIMLDVVEGFESFISLNATLTGEDSCPDSQSALVTAAAGSNCGMLSNDNFVNPVPPTKLHWRCIEPPLPARLKRRKNCNQLCSEYFAGYKCYRAQNKDSSTTECVPDSGDTQCTKDLDYGCSTKYYNAICQCAYEDEQCKGISCLNGGVCEGGECKCMNGYIGPDCSDRPLCAENQYVYDRKCVDCPEGKERPAGDHPFGKPTLCAPIVPESVAQLCAEVTCENNGICEEDSGTCACVDLYEGPTCGKDTLRPNKRRRYWRRKALRGLNDARIARLREQRRQRRLTRMERWAATYNIDITLPEWRLKVTDYREYVRTERRRRRAARKRQDRYVPRKHNFHKEIVDDAHDSITNPEQDVDVDDDDTA